MLNPIIREDEAGLPAVIKTAPTVFPVEDSAEYGLNEFDLSCRYTKWNRGMERITGIPAHDALGRSAFELFAWEGEQNAQRVFDVVLSGQVVGSSQRVEVRGREEWYEVYWAPRHGTGGVVIGGMAIVRPAADTGSLVRLMVERRRPAQAGRRDGRGLMRAIQKASSDAVVTIDAAGRIIAMNGAAQELFGRQGNDGEGPEISALLPGWPGVEAPVSPVDRLFLDAVRAKDETIPVRVSVSEIPLGEQRLFALVVHDVSDARRVEADSEPAASLQQRFEDLEAYSYSVSHELKAPLFAINAISQCLLEDYGERLDDTGRDYLMRLTDASRHLRQLITDLLELSRPEKAERRASRVDVKAVIDALVRNELSEIIEARGAEVRVQADLLDVTCDVTRVEEIFRNLISNGIKFNQSKPPRVEVGCAAVERGVARFYVHDNGIGIDPRHHERVFRAFERLHGHDAYEGTGAGLAIVKRAVEASGGRIWIESGSERETNQTTFWFTLPAWGGQAAVTRTEARSRR
ncbi:MAG: ATP-binding protein [Dehalococcoidia bacterium]